MFYLLDRDERVKELPDVWGTRHTQSLNRESVLELNSLTKIDKYEHILYQDVSGDWHEFVVSGVEEKHEQSGALYYSVFAESVLTELHGDWIDDRRAYGATASVALARALENTRWMVGTVDVPGTADVNFYRESAYSSIGKIVRAFGAELQTRIIVTDGRVSARYVDLLDRIGSDTGARFEWTRNILEIQREILRSDVITALHGYGRGEEVGSGFGRRVSFADINGGLSYVADEDARRRWGRVSTVKSWESVSDMHPTWADMSGTWQSMYDALAYGREHRHGKIEFDDLTDPAAVLVNTQAALERLSQPQVSYSAKVVDLAALDPLAQSVGLGDYATVIDDDLGIEQKLRVIQIVRNPLEPLSDEVTLGQMVDAIAGYMANQTRIVDGMRSIVGVSRLVSEDGKSWLDYSIPEFILDGGEKGKLEISPETIFRLYDQLGRMVAGFVDIDGRKGLMTPFLGNSADGSGGIGMVGHGNDGGLGYRFEHDGHSYMFTFDIEYGLQLYVDNQLTQAWDAFGGFRFYDKNGIARIDVNGITKSMVLRDENGIARFELGADGKTITRDQNGIDRISVLADGALVVRDGENRQRMVIGATGTTYMLSTGQTMTYYQDANQTILQAPFLNGSSISLTATGATKTVGGVTTNL